MPGAPTRPTHTVLRGKTSDSRTPTLAAVRKTASGRSAVRRGDRDRGWKGEQRPRRHGVWRRALDLERHCAARVPVAEDRSGDASVSRAGAGAAGDGSDVARWSRHRGGGSLRPEHGCSEHRHLHSTAAIRAPPIESSRPHIEQDVLPHRATRAGKAERPPSEPSTNYKQIPCPHRRHESVDITGLCPTCPEPCPLTEGAKPPGFVTISRWRRSPGGFLPVHVRIRRVSVESPPLGYGETFIT